MRQTCPSGQFWDTLVRNCMSCQMHCAELHRPPTCTDFCVTMECKTNPGKYYDMLVKRCLPCSEVCGRHPSECVHFCHAQAGVLTSEPADVAAVQAAVHPRSGAQLHMVIIYSLLGLCLAAVVCTLTMAMLVLSRRAKLRKQVPADMGSDVPGQEDHGSSKDHLVEPHRLASERMSCPTETCIHCFPELRVPGRRDNREGPQEAIETPTLYQQAGAMGSGKLAFGELSCCQQENIGPGAKNRSLRIICSPTQSSM